MEKNKKQGLETQGVENQTVELKRAVTISVTAKQLSQLSNEPKLLQMVINQMENSEGGLKGNMAIKVAEETLRQLEMFK